MRAVRLWCMTVAINRHKVMKEDEIVSNTGRIEQEIEKERELQETLARLAPRMVNTAGGPVFLLHTAQQYNTSCI